MDKYDELLCEYEDRISIEERPMVHEGLYCDDVIWINERLTGARKTCILAEELGHYETSAGDILDTDDLKNAKQERLARLWAMEKLIPLSSIKDAYRKGYTDLYHMAEYLDIDEQFLRDCIECYESKYGDIWQEERDSKLAEALMQLQNISE